MVILKSFLSVILILVSSRLSYTEEGELPAVIVLSSTIYIVGSGVYDFGTLHESVRRYNRALEIGFPLKPQDPKPHVRRFSRPKFSREFLLGADSATTLNLNVRVRKSLHTARSWSIGATIWPSIIGLALMKSNGYAAGTTLLFGSWIIGPSAGHWYAGQKHRGWRSVGSRFIAALIGFAAFTQIPLED